MFHGQAGVEATPPDSRAIAGTGTASAGDANGRAHLVTTARFPLAEDLHALSPHAALPANFLPTLDHGDHLHPNDAGYKAMGDAIDLRLFTK